MTDYVLSYIWKIKSLWKFWYKITQSTVDLLFRHVNIVPVYDDERMGDK